MTRRRKRTNRAEENVYIGVCELLEQKRHNRERYGANYLRKNVDAGQGP